MQINFTNGALPSSNATCYSQKELQRDQIYPPKYCGRNFKFKQSDESLRNMKQNLDCFNSNQMLQIWWLVLHSFVISSKMFKWSTLDLRTSKYVIADTTLRSRRTSSRGCRTCLTRRRSSRTGWWYRTSGSTSRPCSSEVTSLNSCLRRPRDSHRYDDVLL